MSLNTRSLLYIARKTREHWPRRTCYGTRREIAKEMRAYLRHNDHRSVRRAYSAGDALYGNI